MDYFQQKKLSDLMSQYQEMKERYPWQWFKPLPNQERFQRFIGDKFQVVLLQGGNWTGKTITGANTVAQIGFTGGIKIGGHFFKMCEVPNHGRVMTDGSLVEKDVIRNLKKMIGPGTYSTEKKGRAFESQWYLESGSEFDIMTYDQDPKQFEGVELNWAWMNEPSTEQIFKAIIGRFKKGGTLFITATVLGCAWILDEIIDANNPRYKVVSMDIDENRESVGGFLPDDSVDDFLRAMDPEEREARKSGKALKLAGLVFKNYKRDAAFKELPEDAPDGATVIMATDPHDKIPHYSAWAYMDAEGRLVVYKEHPTEDFWEFADNPWADEYMLADIYNQIEEVKPVRRLLDKRFGNTAKFGSKLTVKEMLQDAGLEYEDWDGSSVAAQNKRIRTYLEQGKIIISRNCMNMDRAMRRHRFLDQVSGRAKDDRGQREEVDKKYRHPIDVLGALIEAFDDGVMDAPVRDMTRIDDDEDADDLKQVRLKSNRAIFGKEVVLEDDEDLQPEVMSIGELF
jgi:hypothetical protein